jgi:saposin
VGKVEFIKDDDPKCVLCEYVITTLAQRIKNNATEEEIKEELDRVCERMPKSVTKKCEEFVAEYGDLVISYLIQEMDPVGLCTEIHLCKRAGDCFISVGF